MLLQCIIQTVACFFFKKKCLTSFFVYFCKVEGSKPTGLGNFELFSNCCQLICHTIFSLLKKYASPVGSIQRRVINRPIRHVCKWSRLQKQERRYTTVNIAWRTVIRVRVLDGFMRSDLVGVIDEEIWCFINLNVATILVVENIIVSQSWHVVW